MEEVFLVEERPVPRYSYGIKDSKPLGSHVATDTKTTLCGKTRGSDPETDFFKLYQNPDTPLCPECRKRAAMKSPALAKQAREIEAIIGTLRTDLGAAYAHGPVSRALGQLRKAASELMDEAKERALKEALDE